MMRVMVGLMRGGLCALIPSMRPDLQPEHDRDVLAIRFDVSVGSLAEFENRPQLRPRLLGNRLAENPDEFVSRARVNARSATGDHRPRIKPGRLQPSERLALARPVQACPAPGSPTLSSAAPVRWDELAECSAGWE
jgi:hypothetical protein